jgi:tetratricopeptide (TPR) repeat protein
LYPHQYKLFMTFNLIDTVTPLEKRILAYLEKEKLHRDRKIIKIADILIDEKMISSEIVSMHVKYLRKIKSKDHFETLLLALLLADLEEYAESIAVLNEFCKMAGNDPVVKKIQHFIILIKVSEFNDLSNIGQDSLALIENISTEENIGTLLWRLGGIIDARENPELFLKLVNLSIELFPDQFRLYSYQGWIFKEQKRIEPAIASYLKTMEGLTSENDNDYFNFEIASIYHSLAECCLLLPGPDAGKAMGYCDLAQKHDAMTGEFMIESMVLLTRAKAYLMLNDRNEDPSRIIADLNKLIANDPENTEAQEILQQINNN